METKGKRGPKIRREKPDRRNSETQEWGLEGRRHCQISHREKFEKAKLGVPSPLYPLIVRNARNGDERTRPNQRQSNQQGYPIDSTSIYLWCFGLFAPPTSI